MKKSARILAAALWLLAVTTLAGRAVPPGTGSRPNPSPRSARIQAASPTAAITRHSPARPEWGQTLEIVYDPSAPKAAFGLHDEVYAVYSTMPGDGRGWVRLEAEDGLLKGAVPVERGMGYVSFYFVTMERWDRNAGFGVMVLRPDGKPARGANHGEMLETFSPQTYLSYFESERALYPDNYAVYRDKWFIESAVKKGEFEAVVARELPVLEQEAKAARKPSAELLYALSYGNLVLGREEAGRAHLARLVELYPRDLYAALAFSNYEYKALAGQWPGDGPESVRKLAVRLIAEAPESRNARKLIERHVADADLSMETAAAVCRAWIADEPENPSPYFYYVAAAREKGADLREAEDMATRGLRLMLGGNLRLYGDISGGLTGLGTPVLYMARAEFRRDMGKGVDALADVKAARALTKETRPDWLATEGSIWAALGLAERAEASFLEAHRMGARNAEAGLRAIYETRRGTAEGFDEYLAEALEKAKGAAGQAAAGTAGTAAQGARGGEPGGTAGGAGPAPGFAAKALDGADLELSGLRGKVVVLNFWFIGCAPCRAEMPGLNKLVAEFADSDVVFIGFASDPAEELRRFLDGHRFEYRIVPQAGNIARLYGVAVFPTHVIIDKEGRVRYFLTGGSPERHDQLRPLIQSLL